MQLFYIGLGVLSTLYFKDDKIKSTIDNFANEILNSLKGDDNDKRKS